MPATGDQLSNEAFAVVARVAEALTRRARTPARLRDGT
jgi:hypothetical protein